MKRRDLQRVELEVDRKDAIWFEMPDIDFKGFLRHQMHRRRRSTEGVHDDDVEALGPTALGLTFEQEAAIAKRLAE